MIKNILKFIAKVLIATLIMGTLFIMGAYIAYLAGNTVSEGEVVGKEYAPARTWIQSAYVNGTVISMPRRMPAKWKIEVQGVNEDGETVTDIWRVSEEEFNKIRVGDYVRR